MPVGYKQITILVEETYTVPMVDEEITEINGWTLAYLKENWFKMFSLNSYHATRDPSKVGNSRKLIAIDGVKV